MIEFGDSAFYIDLKALDKAITISGDETTVDVETKTTIDATNTVVLTEIYNKSYNKGKMVDHTKYEMLKLFIEYVMDYDEITDDSLGAERALNAAPLSYKIIFNTLLNEKIIKEK